MTKIIVAIFLVVLSVSARSEEIRVLPANGMPLVSAQVDGVQCVLLLDTGASHTTLDFSFVTNRFPRIALRDVSLVGRTNVTKNVPKFAEVSRLKVCDMDFETEGVMVLDLSHLRRAVGADIAGIVGMNTIREKPCLISLGSRKLCWNPREEEKTGFFAVPIRDRGTTFDLLVKLTSGREVPMLLDTGSSYTFLNRSFVSNVTERVKLNATDVNHEVDTSVSRGARQSVICGDFSFEFTPFLTDSPHLNQIGFDTLKDLDLLFEGGRVFLRKRL